MADNNQSIDNSDGTNGTDQQIISTPTTSTADILPPPDPTIATITSTTTTFTTTVANPSTSNGTIPKHSISSPMHYAQFQPPMYTNPYYHPFNQPFPNQPNPLHVNPPNPLIFQPNPNPNMQPPVSMHAPLPNVQYANQPNLVYQSNVTNNAYPQSSTAQPPHTSNAQPSYQGNTAPQRPTGVNIGRNISNISTPSSYSPYSPYYSPQHTTPQSILNKDYSSDLSDITNKSSTPPLPFEQTDKSLSDVSSSPPLRDDRDIDPSYKPYQFYKGPRDNTPIQTRSRTRLQNQELIKQNPDIPTFSYELYRDNDSYTSLPTLPPNQNSNNIQTSTPTSSRDNNKPDERTGAIPKIRKNK
ncbi:UNVERIFIED_CONTAM: hypothetical protein RMT77_006960 [Armadillidium vulgare]